MAVSNTGSLVGRLSPGAAVPGAPLVTALAASDTAAGADAASVSVQGADTGSGAGTDSGAQVQGSTITSAAALTGNTASGITTLSVTGTAIGDLWVVYVCVRSSSITATGISSPNTTGWTNVTGNWLDGTGSANESIWIGKMTAAGADTLTVSFSGSVTGITNTIDAHPFHSSLASPSWTVDGTGGHLANSASTTVSFPTLAPSGSNPELYWGHARVPGTATTPTPAGFATSNDSNGDPEIYRVSVSSSVSPTLTQSSGTSQTIAIMVSDSSLTTVVTGADTGAGVDTATVAATSTVADTGAGADTGAASVAAPSADTAAGSEAQSLLMPGSESGAGADAGTLQLASADTGAGSDASSPLLTASADTAAGSEASTVRLSGAADSGAATESAQETTAVTGADSGAGADTASVKASDAGADTGAGADAASLAAAATASDAAVGSEASALRMQGAESGSGTESTSIQVAWPVSDSGSGADAGSVKANLTDADTASGADAALLIAAASDPQRAVFVEEEVRIYVIPLDTRTLTIEFEDRTDRITS